MLAAVSPRVGGLGWRASPSGVLESCPTFGCIWGRDSESHDEKWHTAVDMVSKKVTWSRHFPSLERDMLQTSLVPRPSSKEERRVYSKYSTASDHRLAVGRLKRGLGDHGLAVGRSGFETSYKLKIRKKLLSGFPIAILTARQFSIHLSRSQLWGFLKLSP